MLCSLTSSPDLDWDGMMFELITEYRLLGSNRWYLISTALIDLEELFRELMKGVLSTGSEKRVSTKQWELLPFLYRRRVAVSDVSSIDRRWERFGRDDEPSLKTR
jgi:hypothetical protein